MKTLREEAEIRGITIDKLRKDCSLGKEPDAFNQGGKWYFKTDDVDVENLNPQDFPSIDESKTKFEYFRALKMEAEASQAIRASKRAIGQLVNKKQIEDEYKRGLVLLKDNLLQIPNRLKHRLAETPQFTIDTLEDLIREVLEDASS